MDIFIKSTKIKEKIIESENTKSEVFTLPIGEKIQIKEMIQFTGGGAANSAFGFAKMGLTAACFGVVGNEDGDAILQPLSEAGVDTHHVIREGKKSSFSVIITGNSGRRTVLHHRSESKTFGKKIIQSIPKCRAIYSGHLNPQSQEILFEIPKWKKNNPNGIWAWNPGKTQFYNGFDTFKNVFPSVDYLILNQEEAELFTSIKSSSIEIYKSCHKNGFPEEIIGKKIPIHLPEHIPKSTGDVRKCAKKFLDAGIKSVVITDGRAGAQYFDTTHHYYIPTENTTPVCTLGAGDAFSVGVLTARLHNQPIKKQLQIGHANAAATVNKYGAQKGVLTKKDIKEMLS